MGADLWMIGRIDQFALVAAHNALRNRLVRWDSPIRFCSALERRLFARQRPRRSVAEALDPIPGRHIIPELMASAVMPLGAGVQHTISDTFLDLLAFANRPRDYRILHGQQGYCLASARRAIADGRVFICDLISQLAETRRRNLTDEYAANGFEFSDSLVPLLRAQKAALIADAVFVPSEGTRQSAIEHGVAVERIHVIPYDSPLAGGLLRVPQAQAGQTPRLRLLYVGLVGIQKGLRVLLEAVHRLRQKIGEDVTLTIVGPYGAGGAALLAERPDWIRYLGLLRGEKIRDVYFTNDLFVFPSLSEGCPLVVIEALAAGLPVITTLAGAAVVQDEVDGLIVPPRNSEALADAIARLHLDRNRLCAMAQAAREGALARTQRSYPERVERAYDEVLYRSRYQPRPEAQAVLS